MAAEYLAVVDLAVMDLASAWDLAVKGRTPHLQNHQVSNINRIINK